MLWMRGGDGNKACCSAAKAKLQIARLPNRSPLFAESEGLRAVSRAFDRRRSSIDREPILPNHVAQHRDNQ